jgi:hypothetical protein
LPRSLNLFERDSYESSTYNPSFLDLDAYGDLDHLPLGLKRVVSRDIRVMQGYCEIFGIIRRCLEQNKTPIPWRIHQRIWYFPEYYDSNARLFLGAEGGHAKYALQYLINTMKDIMVVRNIQKDLEEGLELLPRCLNDTGYCLLQKMLVGM